MFVEKYSPLSKSRPKNLELFKEFLDGAAIYSISSRLSLKEFSLWLALL